MDLRHLSISSFLGQSKSGSRPSGMFFEMPIISPQVSKRSFWQSSFRRRISRSIGRDLAAWKHSKHSKEVLKRLERAKAPMDRLTGSMVPIAREHLDP